MHAALTTIHTAPAAFTHLVASGTGWAAAVVGPTCGLPNEVVAISNKIIGWEKGILVLSLFGGAILCLIVMVIGRAFSWRHVSEGASVGLVTILAIAALASVLTAIMTLLLSTFSC